jgi:thymidylate synthase (FAD)
MKIDVLDNGYVRLVDSMGDDLTVVNSAKVSFDKEANEYGERERGLVAFLFSDGHWSTVRHNVVTFEVYAPLMVARQWWKYAVSSAHVEDQRGWNESSRRYITEEPTFYIPKSSQWRTAPENKKQGSGKPLEGHQGWLWTKELEEYIDQGVTLYERAMERGIAAEQARLFLPAYGMYVRWRWTCSLQTLVHFFGERLASDAQHEIHDYAQAVYDLTNDLWPRLAEQIEVH